VNQGDSEQNEVDGMKKGAGAKYCGAFSRFDRTPACDARTSNHTDVFRQHSPRYAYMHASRDKNEYVKVSCEYMQ